MKLCLRFRYCLHSDLSAGGSRWHPPCRSVSRLVLLLGCACSRPIVPTVSFDLRRESALRTSAQRRAGYGERIALLSPSILSALPRPAPTVSEAESAGHNSTWGYESTWEYAEVTVCMRFSCSKIIVVPSRNPTVRTTCHPIEALPSC